MENMLTRIHKDMAVYDHTGKKIGTVKNVKFGDEDPERLGVETSTAETPSEAGSNIVELEYAAEALTPEDQIPEELRERLQRYGYIQVDTGILTSDRFASLDQIANVTTDRVDLKVTKDGLIKS